MCKRVITKGHYKSIIYMVYIKVVLTLGHGDLQGSMLCIQGVFLFIVVVVIAG